MDKTRTCCTGYPCSLQTTDCLYGGRRRVHRRGAVIEVHFGCERFDLELSRSGSGPVKWRVSSLNSATARLVTSASGQRSGLNEGARAAVIALKSAGMAEGVDETELVAALITPFYTCRGR